MERLTTNNRATLTLMVTHQCNLNCTYCYEKSKTSGKAMTLDSAKAIIAKAFTRFSAHFDEMEIDFMGGEPLMEFPLIKSIAEWVWSKEWPIPYVMFATTNGTLVSEANIGWLTEHKDKFILGLSYDGTPDSQDTNRAKSSNKIDMRFFSSTWPKQPVKMTISPYSIDCLSDGVQYLHKQGFNHIHANLAFGEKWLSGHLSVYKLQLLKLAEFYLHNPSQNRVSLLDLDLAAILDEKYTTKYCGAGTGMIFVDNDEKEYPCHILSPITLNKEQISIVKKTDFTEGELFATDYCKNCLLYNLCPNCCGMNLIHNGGYNRKSRFLCDALKIQVLINVRLQYQLLTQKKELKTSDVRTAQSIKKIIKAKIV